MVKTITFLEGVEGVNLAMLISGSGIQGSLLVVFGGDLE